MGCVFGTYDYCGITLHALTMMPQCNGFSAGVNPDDFRGPGFQSGYDPVWCDLLAKHADQPYHALVGGGDQIYCDGCVVTQFSFYWVLNRSTQADART